MNSERRSRAEKRKKDREKKGRYIRKAVGVWVGGFRI